MSAPVRFLPEFDSLLLSHADRSRVMSEDHRRAVFTVNGIIRATILVNGRVAGMWKVDRDVLRIQPFAPIAARVRTALTAEGRRLMTFLDDAGGGRVEFLPAPDER